MVGSEAMEPKGIRSLCPDGTIRKVTARYVGDREDATYGTGYVNVRGRIVSGKIYKSAHVGKGIEARLPNGGKGNTYWYFVPLPAGKNADCLPLWQLSELPRDIAEDIALFYFESDEGEAWVRSGMYGHSERAEAD